MDATADLIFLGYRAKRPWYVRTKANMEQTICCVGPTMCEPPPNWVDRWDFNRANCYDTPQAAWAAVTVEPDRSALFAYFIFPVDLTDDEEEIFSIDEIFQDNLPEVPTSPPDLSGMILLGYDVTECQDWFIEFGQSPLADSGLSREFPTNCYGLLDDFDEAVTACKFINTDMPEHAPMWVIQVFGDESVNDLRSNCDFLTRAGQWSYD